MNDQESFNQGYIPVLYILRTSQYRDLIITPRPTLYQKREMAGIRDERGREKKEVIQGTIGE